MSPLVVHSGSAAIKLSGHTHLLSTATANPVFGGGVYHTDPSTGYTYYVPPGSVIRLPNGTMVSGGPGSGLGGGYGPYGQPDVPPKLLELPTEKREMPVVGYRGWNWTSKFRLGYGTRGSLTSTGMPNAGAWLKNQETAFCASNMPHPAPDPNCGCGLYVLANMDELESHVSIQDALVVGAVVGWGRVIQHGREGWRAQYARILALLDCKFSEAQLKTTREAAKEYKVPVLGRDGLERYVREWGDPFAEPVTPALTEGRST